MQTEMNKFPSYPNAISQMHQFSPAMRQFRTAVQKKKEEEERKKKAEQAKEALAMSNSIRATISKTAQTPMGSTQRQTQIPPWMMSARERTTVQNQQSPALLGGNKANSSNFPAAFAANTRGDGTAAQTGVAETRKQYGQTASVDAANAFMPTATENLLSKLRLTDNAFAKFVTDRYDGSAFATSNAGTKKLARVLGYKDGDRVSKEQLTKDLLVASAFGSINTFLSQSKSSANTRSAREDATKKSNGVQKPSTEHALFLKEILDRGSRAYAAGVRAGLSGDVAGRELAGQQFAESVELLQSAAQEGAFPAEGKQALQVLSRVMSADGSDSTFSDKNPAQQSVDTQEQEGYTEEGSGENEDDQHSELKKTLQGIWDTAKWMFKITNYPAYFAQKTSQRMFWWAGAELYLKRMRGFDSAAELLKHSLQDHPKPIYLDSKSKLAGQLAESKEVNDIIDAEIAGSDGEVVPIDNKIVIFKGGDLFYSLHKGTINGEGVRQPDGSWLITGTLTDLYDFSEITTLMDEKKYSPDVSLGSVANDVAVFSQLTDAIKPYDVTVDFVIRR